MSRKTTLIILAVVLLIAAIGAISVFLLGRGYFIITERRTAMTMPASNVILERSPTVLPDQQLTLLADSATTSEIPMLSKAQPANNRLSPADECPQAQTNRTVATTPIMAIGSLQLSDLQLERS